MLPPDGRNWQLIYPNIIDCLVKSLAHDINFANVNCAF